MIIGYQITCIHRKPHDLKAINIFIFKEEQ